MSLLSLSKQYIAVAVGHTLNVFCRNTAKLLFTHECDGTDVIKLQSDSNKQSDAQQNVEEEKEVTVITHIVYAAKHDYFVVVTENKQIRLFMHRNTFMEKRTPNNNNDADGDVNVDKPAAVMEDLSLYVLFSHRKMDKKTSTLCLSSFVEKAETTSEQYLITADKFGVIYVHYLPSLATKQDGHGHLCTITHVAMDVSGKYVLSCDKDFKIRISRFPQMYIIDGFCYGHTQAVTKCVTVQLPANDDNSEVPQFILSGSVDGTVRFWRMPFADPLSVYKFVQKTNVAATQLQEQKHAENAQTQFEIDCDLEATNEALRGQPLVVTHLKYNASSNVVAIAFNKSSKIYLFEVRLSAVEATDNESQQTPTLVFCTAFSVAACDDDADCVALYDLVFDDTTGSLLTLSAHQSKAVAEAQTQGKLRLQFNVATIGRNDEREMHVEIQNQPNNVVHIIQQQIEQICQKMAKCQIVPLYLDLLRSWGVGGDREQTHQKPPKKETQNPTNTGNDANIQEPPVKKRKLDDENSQNETS